MTFDTDAINNIKFGQGFRGYDTAEVDEFLDDMIREIEKLNATIKNLKDELSKEKRKNQLSQQEIDRLTQINESLANATDNAPAAEEIDVKPIVEEEEPKPIKIKKPASMEDIKGTPEYEEMKQILTDTLLSAHQHAEKLVKDAKERANKMIEDGERKAQDRVVVLKTEIREQETKLDELTTLVQSAKERFKRNFQDQITALDNIVTGKKSNEIPAEVKIGELALEEDTFDEPEETLIAKPQLPSLDDIITEKVEEKKEEARKEEITEDREVSTFDFAAIKKSLSRDNEMPSQEEKKPAEPFASNQFKSVSPANIPDEEEENKQYIEIALSAYNDNKHHNTDYPDTPSDIKISEDDEEGGIYQPENRSVLSSVIEEILNNKRNDDK